MGPTGALILVPPTDIGQIFEVLVTKANVCRMMRLVSQPEGDAFKWVVEQSDFSEQEVGVL